MKSNWRFDWFKGRIKNLHIQRQEDKLNKNRQEAEQIMKRVDEILDKISEVGIENLSKEERKFLEEASSELSKKNLNK